MAVEVLDSHYLALMCIITVVFQLLGWVVSVALRTEAHFDFLGGLNYILVALLSLFLKGSYTARQLAATAVVVSSRAELAAFLAFRVVMRGGDTRFEEAKKSALVMLVPWGLQIFWVLLVVSPCLYINGSDKDPDFGLWDVIGLSMAVIGFLCESLADVQKYRFRSDDSNKGKVCEVGLWYYSRHPNYFGEIVHWWGVFVMGVPVFADDAGGFATVVSPLFTMLLLLGVSGIPLAEGRNLKRFYKTSDSGKAFDEYFDRTSPLIPCPPCLYTALPSAAKLLCCFEFASFKYRPVTDSEAVTSDKEPQDKDVVLLQEAPGSYGSDADGPSAVV